MRQGGFNDDPWGRVELLPLPAAAPRRSLVGFAARGAAGARAGASVVGYP